MLHMSDMGFKCCTLYLNAAVSQFAITIGKELFNMQTYYKLASYFLRMAELALVDYFVMVNKKERKRYRTIKHKLIILNTNL